MSAYVSGSGIGVTVKRPTSKASTELANTRLVIRLPPIATN